MIVLMAAQIARPGKEYGPNWDTHATLRNLLRIGHGI
jgi:hypothetical protein